MEPSSIEVNMKRSWLIILTLVTGVMCAGRGMAQCTDMTDRRLSYDPSDEHRELIATKIDYALAVISNEQQLQSDPDCVANALSFLGEFQVEKAIPRMLALLTFEHKVANPISTWTRNRQYPAISGLAGIGKPAVPALLKTISESRTELERDNALQALTTIYAGHPKQVIDMLQKSADAEPDYGKAANDRAAASKVPRIACRDGDVLKCNE
jgi:hypothetical protein